ncbi:hypothetical protein IAT38_002270 [Cryptococcus sp. DSM 104549]
MAAKLTLQSTLPLISGGSVPRIGLGTGGLTGQIATDAVKHAVKAGYRLVDSAIFYGNNEAVGTGIKQSSIPRSSLFLVSKYAAPVTIPGTIISNPVASSPNLSPSEILAELRKSTELLDQSGKDAYVDLLLVHHPWPDAKARANAWEALVQAKKEGWAKAIGVSNFNIAHIEALPGPDVPEVNQLEIHPFCQQREVVAYCRSRGMQIQAYCPTIRFIEEKVSHPVIKGLAEKRGKTIGQVLLRWSLQSGFIPIPRSSNPERIKDNIALYDFELTAEDMEALDGLDQGAAGHVAAVNPADLPL